MTDFRIGKEWCYEEKRLQESRCEKRYLSKCADGMAKTFTDIEKVFRWAINKYYFTAHKNSLKTCDIHLVDYSDAEKGLLL